jgi:hypothetical protein
VLYLGLLGVAECQAFKISRTFGLPRKYHLKAIKCEKRAEHASDLTTRKQWHELATQWRSMADQAARTSNEAFTDLEMPHWWDSIEPRGCHLSIAEHGWPFFKCGVGGDDDRVAFVEPVDEDGKLTT